MKAVLLSAALLLMPAAAAAQTAVGGVPGPDDTLTYADGTTVTMDAPGGGSFSPNVMDQSGFWGGSGDYSGVYTPAGIADEFGLVAVYPMDEQGCTRGLGVREVTECTTTRILTFTFSRPVTDAVLHLHNLGGSSNMGHAHYASLALTSPSTSMELLSRGGNFQVTGGNAIEVIKPLGDVITGVPPTDADELRDFRLGLANLRPLDPDNPAANDYYGTGSGSVRVLGTYTKLAFRVTFYIRNILNENRGIGGTEGLGFQFNVPPAVTAAPAAVPPSLVCTPDPVAPGGTVTCTVTGGDPDIDILWNASYSGVFAGAGVTLDGAGQGQFSFVAPCAAAGQAVSVELVEWTRPISIAVTDGACGPIPTRVPAGEGPAGADAFLLALFGTAALSYLGWTQVGRRSGRRFASAN